MSKESYRKKCMFCDQEILMDINGNSKWAAFNLNGGYHVCKKQEPPIVMINEGGAELQHKLRVSPEAKAWVKEIQECPTKVKLLEERLKRIEEVLFQELGFPKYPQ